MVVALSLLALFVQTPKPFKANTQIGQMVRIGYDQYQGGRIQDWGNNLKIALDSARVALAYPCKDRVILAEPKTKLLVMSVSIINPSKSTLVLGGDSMPGVRFWDAHGSTNFHLVNFFDPKTKTLPKGSVATGKGAKFDIVVSIPADYIDFRLGLSFHQPQYVAWLDLREKMGKDPSLFWDGYKVAEEADASAGKPFDLGPLELVVLGEVPLAERKGGVPSDPGVKVFSVTAKNTQSAPCRWGWQYMESTLILEDGTKIGAYPGMFDATTGAGFIGDLEPGQASTVQLVFSTTSALKAKTLVAKWPETNRTAKVSLDGAPSTPKAP